MKKKILTIRYAKKIIILFCLFITISTVSVYAQTATSTPTPTTSSVNTSDLQQKIKEYQGKIDDLQSQAKTLSSQISLVDNQISLSELRIEDAKTKITKLENDIDIAQKKIKQLESNIGSSTKALLGRIRAVYHVGQAGPWEIFLSSDNISNFMTRLTYLRMVQIYDKKNIYAAEQNRINYEHEKKLFQEKQEEAEDLKHKLEDFNTQLEKDKQKKQELLAVTKNSESEYQRRLSDAMRELTQIQKAAQLLVTSEPKDVNRGDGIGLMGSSGYAFGAHLHFGLYNITSLNQYNYYSGYEDPKNILQPQTVDWQTECGSDPHGMSQTGSGSFGWPMSVSGLRITQNYGHTCYSNVYYRGNPHPALDMYNNSDIIVRASEAGKAYVCRNCTGDGGNGVFIFHSNGKMTLYWHLQ